MSGRFNRTISDEEFDSVCTYAPYTIVPFNTVGICTFNNAVDCTDKDGCNKCGWNPAVQKIMGMKIKERMRGND